MSERLIEMRLSSLASEIAYPATPEIASKVAARLRHAPPRPSFGSRFGLRIAIATAAVIAVAFTSVVALSPSARRAVADRLGIDGISITFDHVDHAPLGDKLYLGAPVSLDEAQDAVPFSIEPPSKLGEPDAVYLNRYVASGEVSLVYESRVGLPVSAQTNVGALLTEFVGTPKFDYMKKIGAPATEVIPVTVEGHEGFFVYGAPHVLITTPDGGRRTLTPRLAGNTLIWDAGEVSYRLEVELDLEQALEIARSVG